MSTKCLGALAIRLAYFISQRFNSWLLCRNPGSKTQSVSEMSMMARMVLLLIKSQKLQGQFLGDMNLDYHFLQTNQRNFKRQRMLFNAKNTTYPGSLQTWVLTRHLGILAIVKALLVWWLSSNRFACIALIL